MSASQVSILNESVLDDFCLAVRINDCSTVDRFYRILEPEIQMLASVYGRNGAICSELAQDIRIALWESANKFQPDRGVPFHRYVRTAISNRAIYHLRSEKRRNKRFPLCAEIGDDEVHRSIGDPGPEHPELGLLRNVDSTYIRGRIASWARTLSPRHQQLLELHFVQGKTKAEAARTMQISKAAVTKAGAAIVASGQLALADLTDWSNN